MALLPAKTYKKVLDVKWELNWLLSQFPLLLKTIAICTENMLYSTELNVPSYVHAQTQRDKSKQGFLFDSVMQLIWTCSRHRSGKLIRFQIRLLRFDCALIRGISKTLNDFTKSQDLVLRKIRKLNIECCNLLKRYCRYWLIFRTSIS